MRSRVRAALTAAELSRMYATPHRHDQWPDHVLRMAETIKLGKGMLASHLSKPESVVIADLSCGDAAIARALAAATREMLPHTPSRVILGDFAPGWEMHGPMESTIAHLTRADLFICTETLEHLEDPDAVLCQVRAKAGLLLVSTPDAEPPGVNPEHLWTWNRDDLREMLTTAGWEPFAGRSVTWADQDSWTWAYQIWGCK